MPISDFYTYFYYSADGRPSNESPLGRLLELLEHEDKGAMKFKLFLLRLIEYSSKGSIDIIFHISGSDSFAYFTLLAKELGEQIMDFLGGEVEDIELYRYKNLDGYNIIADFKITVDPSVLQAAELSGDEYCTKI